MKRVIALLTAGVIILSAASYACAEEKSFDAEHKNVKERFKQNKEELRQRLNLTTEQQEKAKQIRENARPVIKPLFEQIHQKKQEIRELRQSGATREELQPKIDEIKSLRQKADALRKENMQKFEAILTPEQKAEFNKFKEEKKQKWQEHKGKRKEHRKEMWEKRESGNFDED